MVTSATPKNFPLKCLSVIVPVYNELTTIRQILTRIASVPLPKEIIVVDDASTDGTADILRKMTRETLAPADGDSLLGFKVLFHDRNRGKGAGIRTGISHATGELLVVQDADLEYDPFEYGKLIEPILCGDADVVYGSRFRGERQRVHLYWHRMGNTILTMLSNICTNLNLSDMETCFKAFKTDIIRNIPLRSNRFGFDPEVTAKVAKLRLVIYEVPITYRGRGYEEGKKINWRDGVAAVYTILKFWLLDDLYDKTHDLSTIRKMEGAGLYNEWLFSQCRPYLGDRVVEVGAGTGNMIKYMLNKDLVVATDVNSTSLDELNRKYAGASNVKIEAFDVLRPQMANQIAREFSPDSVLAVNVLEQIEDEKAALKSLNRLLPVNGRIVLLVPAHERLFSNIDKNLGYLRRYSRKRMMDLLSEAGFRVEKVRYVNMMGALGWFVNGKIFRKRLLPSRQLRVFDWLVGALRLEKYLNPPFGLSVLAVAQKVQDLS